MKLRLATLLVLLLPLAAPAAPRLQRGALADGTALVTVDQPSAVASLRWIVRSGALDDPLGKPGLARVVGRAVLEGGYGEDGAALRRDVERAGGRLEVRTGPDATVFRLDAPTGRFLELARRLVRIVTSPALPEAPVARVQRLVETSARPGPRPLPERLGSILFPPTVAAEGLAASNADLVSFFEAHYVPANITVVVVGDIERADVASALEEADRLAPSADEPPMTLPSPSERPLRAQARAPLTRTVVGYEVGPVSSRLCRGLAGLLELRLRQAWTVEAPRAQEVRGWCVRMNGAGFLLGEVAGGRAPDLAVIPGIRQTLQDLARRPATPAETARLQAAHAAGWASLAGRSPALADRIAGEVISRVARDDDLEDAVLGPPDLDPAAVDALAKDWMHRAREIVIELGPDL